jgi:hypothetical protein
MLLFTVINLLGVRWLVESNGIAVLWKIFVPVVTIIVLITVSFRASNFTAGGRFAPYGVRTGFLRLCPRAGRPGATPRVAIARYLRRHVPDVTVREVWGRTVAACGGATGGNFWSKVAVCGTSATDP